MRDDADDMHFDVEDAMRMTADIVASFVANNKVMPEQLPDLIRSVHKTINTLSSGQEERVQEKPKPAVPINKSVSNEYIICLEDGKRLKMLKRYLRSTYGLSPDEYRKRWNLPADYPMVAPAYAAKRSAFAKSIGLGRGVRRKE
jgi:predicted transcriptional regulator